MKPKIGGWTTVHLPWSSVILVSAELLYGMATYGMVHTKWMLWDLNVLYINEWTWKYVFYTQYQGDEVFVE